MTALFLIFVLSVAAALLLVATRGLPDPQARTLQVGLPLWLIYVGALSYSGLIGNPSIRPPAIIFIVVPVVLFIVLAVGRSASGRIVALAWPLWLVIGLQSYRVVVELFLHQLAQDHLVPSMLTFDGANYDIFIGATAPVVAWMAARRSFGLRVALAWNVLGLAALANVVVRSALTAPGPLNYLHVDPPNLAIGIFPYTYIAGFLAPLGVSLHILALRAVG